MKRFPRAVFALLMVLSVPPLSAAGESAGRAPFGLQWGQSPEIVKTQVPDLEPEQQRGNLHSYSAIRVPERLGGAARYHLLFDDLAGLVKVQYVGTLIDQDPAGILGRERYATLREALQEKYGEPELEEMQGLAPGEEPPAFYDCLRMKGCGWWHATYRSAGMKVRLQLHGARADTGFITLVYESPAFDAALARYERERQLTHENAL